MRDRWAVLVLLLLSSLSAFALSAGPEFPAADPPIEPAPGGRSTPLVASNGDGFLVVWNDRRGGASEIRSARVGRDGVLLDPRSRLVAANAGSVTAVASNGRDYLVAFHCNSGSRPAICLERIDAVTGVALPAATIPGSFGALAPNGNGYFLVYLNGTPGTMQPVVGRALREDGTPAAEPFTIGASPYGPAVAANGRAFFAIWSTYAHLEGVLVSDSAVTGAQQRMTTAAPSFGPGPFGWSVASNGDGFLVAWQQNTGAVNQKYTTDVRVSAVSPAGVAGAPRTVVAEKAWEPALAWNGSEYLLSFTHSSQGGAAPYLFSFDDADVRVLALSATGEPRDSDLPYAVSQSRQARSAIAASRTSTLVVWEDQLRADAALIVARLTNGTGTLIVSTTDAWQQNVDISRTAARTLVAWEEIGGPSQLSRIVVHRYEAFIGVPNIGRETFVVQPSANHQRRPALGSIMVSWVEEDPERLTASASIWYQALEGWLVGSRFNPVGRAERVADAARGTRVDVMHQHVFHIMLYTAPDGRLQAVPRSLLARIGYDPSPRYVTEDAAVNPASAPYVSSTTPALVAYNHPVPEACPVPCVPRNTIRATVLWENAPAKSIDIAPIGASEPHVVFDGKEFLVFWSMDNEPGTFVQRVSTAGGVPVPVGGPRRIHDATLHDVETGRNGELVMVVEERDRFLFLRVDANSLNVIQSSAFTAFLAGNSRIHIGSTNVLPPMLAYAAPRPGDGASSRIVLRLVDENLPIPKRRSVR